MSAPTPGPWNVCHDAGGNPYVWIEARQGPAVAHVVQRAEETTGYIPSTDRIEDNPEALANAHLIAAAPDLLAACEAVIGALGATFVAVHQDCPLCQAARHAMTAIRQAQGEAP